MEEKDRAYFFIMDTVIPLYQEHGEKPPRFEELVDLVSLEGFDRKAAAHALMAHSQSDRFFYEKLGYNDTEEDIISGAQLIRDYAREIYNSGKFPPYAKDLVIFAHETLGLSPKSANQAFNLSVKEHKGYYKAMGYELDCGFMPPGELQLHIAKSRNKVI